MKNRTLATHLRGPSVNEAQWQDFVAEVRRAFRALGDAFPEVEVGLATEEYSSWQPSKVIYQNPGELARLEAQNRDNERYRVNEALKTLSEHGYQVTEPTKEAQDV